MSTVHNLGNEAVAPKEIKSYLRNHSETLATQQDIYNCMAQGKRDLAKGQSNIHALANELDSEGFWNRMQLVEYGRVTGVLFAHPQSLASSSAIRICSDWTAFTRRTSTRCLFSTSLEMPVKDHSALPLPS
ncbi:transposase [Metarhizium robertsii ARSEF 23]|uniref:Transposase n=1 Tax=Metarhizium robertsii (strain ARSEF 23 / ATCC MYA-3075) TaxID=655844 RepID=A0A0B2XG88_METRA|nr:transposase [Metarhizium robertsii ARSEF 23]KHO10961.1 transposase [Metarhizium robertsii ARSEF 23]